MGEVSVKMTPRSASKTEHRESAFIPRPMLHDGEELSPRVGEAGCPVAELCQVVTEAPQKVN